MGIINKAQLTSKIQNPDGNKVEVTTSSNSCLTNKIDEDVSLVKTPAKDWALPKEKVKLTTQITNNTNANITNFTFKETLGKSATFVPGTVTIGDEPHAAISIPRLALFQPLSSAVLARSQTLVMKLKFLNIPKKPKLKRNLK